jgi:hypothetical protein
VGSSDPDANPAYPRTPQNLSAQSGAPETLPAQSGAPETLPAWAESAVPAWEPEPAWDFCEASPWMPEAAARPVVPEAEVSLGPAAAQSGRVRWNDRSRADECG